MKRLRSLWILTLTVCLFYIFATNRAVYAMSDMLKTVVSGNKTIVSAIVQIEPAAAAGSEKEEVSEEVAGQILSRAEEISKSVINLNNYLNQTFESKIDIDIPKCEGVTAVSLSLPASVIRDLKDKKIDSLEVSSGIASVTIALDSLSILELDKIDKVELDIAQADKATLSDEQKAVIEENPVYDFSLKLQDKDGNGMLVDKFNDPTEIKIPYTLKEGQNPEKITVFYVDENGALENRNGRYEQDTKIVTFKTYHFSKYTIKQNSAVFNDVASDSWSKKYIDIMAAKGIVTGMTDTNFNPDDTVTRAQFVSMLVRAFNPKKSDSCLTCRFIDGVKDAWYAQNVMDAVDAQLVKGYEDWTFRPDNRITREEMAIIAANTMNTFRAPKNADEAELEFADINEIHGYAKESVALAVKNGVISGKPGNVFDPQAYATRAEAAKIVYMIYNMK